MRLSTQHPKSWSAGLMQSAWDRFGLTRIQRAGAARAHALQMSDTGSTAALGRGSTQHACT